jgi:hypothetical protein
MSQRLEGRAGRWVAGAALVLGLLLVVVAPILRLWVAPLLAQSPQVPGGDGQTTFTSTGTVTTLFDLDNAEQAVTGESIPVTHTVTTRGDAAAAQQAAAEGLNVAVADSVDRVVTDDGRLISELPYRLAADRRSQALADCCGARVGGIEIAMAGAGNPLRLPWFTPERSYPYFDTALLAPVEMAYIGSERLGDVEAMKFQQTTGPTAVGTVPVPGRLVGSEQTTATLVRTHAVNRTLWVDPTTGIILRSAEKVRETLREDSGPDVVTLLSMSLASTPEQEAAQLAQARAEGQQVLWARTYGPALSLGIGLALVVGGLVAIAVRIRAQRAEEDFPDEFASFDDLKEALD